MTRHFGKLKPFLSNKGDFHEHTTLIDGKEIISEDKKVAEKLNNSFEKAFSCSSAAAKLMKERNFPERKVNRDRKILSFATYVPTAGD